MAFNEFFASIGERPSKIVNPAPKSWVVENRTTNSFFLTKVDPLEILKIINNLKNKKSCGIDEIPPTLLKQCAEELALPLCLLINQSFDDGIFPDTLKISLVKPLHKKNSKTDPNNYRPIALLPTASKIFEKVMYDRVYKFCEKYDIFDATQHGFRKKMSTTLAVFNYIQETLNIINKKQYAVGLLLDMCKAYDKVKFNILLNKLYDIGIRGIAHKWFKSYLTNRYQYVQLEYYNYSTQEIENIRSEGRKLTASIPQGSVIGCLLFLIYVNDLPKNIAGKCVLFADDISLLTSCQTNSELENKLSPMLQSTVSWLDAHNLEINFNKTKIMLFHPEQKKTTKYQFRI